MPTQEYALTHYDQEVDSTPTLHSKLRDLLTDRQWHASEELAEQISHRFAAALHIVRYGLDGRPPLDIEARREPDSHMYRYRWTGEHSEPERRPRCDKCGHLLPRSQK